MAGKILALDRSWIPEISRFLKAGFLRNPNDYSAFAEPAVLDWKFFQPRGPWNVPRSLGVAEGDKLAAHIGVSTTEIFTTRSNPACPAIHLTDWLASSDQGSLGAMIMLKAFGSAPVQYTFGCTDAAKAVLSRVGYQQAQLVPMYHHILNPWKSGPWIEIHGQAKFPRNLAFRIFDYLQNFRGFIRPVSPSQSLSIHPVTQFGNEVLEIIASCKLAINHSSRAPELLNYYLSHPHGRFHGWLIRRDSIPIGFAVTCSLNKPGVVIGRIVELFLVDDDHHTWSWALNQLKEILRGQKCELLSCCGSVPWCAKALLAAGFFRRGKTPLYLRDPKKLIPSDKPWHLTFIEADLSII